jgi:hypothetical protein
MKSSPPRSKRYFKNKRQKQASNVETEAMKHSQEKQPPFLFINMGAGDAQTCLPTQ